MSGWRVWFYLGGQRKENVIRAWLGDERVSKAQTVAFQEKIDAFETGGPDMVPGFMTETPIAKDIYKLKIKGNKGMKQLRPLCCRGPFGPTEITVLVGAVERDGELDPSDAIDRAQSNLKVLRADPSRRIHERLTPKPESSDAGTHRGLHIAPKPYR